MLGNFSLPIRCFPHFSLAIHLNKTSLKGLQKRLRKQLRGWETVLAYQLFLLFSFAVHLNQAAMQKRLEKQLRDGSHFFCLLCFCCSWVAPPPHLRSIKPEKYSGFLKNSGSEYFARIRIWDFSEIFFFAQ